MISLSSNFLIEMNSNFLLRTRRSFVDLEEEIKLLTDPYAIRSAYLKAIHTSIENYRESCTQNLMDYFLLDTSIGLDRALVQYLKWREKFR